MATLTYGRGRPTWVEAIHMNPARLPTSQAPVMRESARVNQLLPPGPAARYGPADHGEVRTSNDVTLPTAGQ